MKPDHRLEAARLVEIVEAMFSHDERGRLVGSAPHFYALRSPDHVVVRIHATLDGGVARALDVVAARPRGRPSTWEQDCAQIVGLLAVTAPLQPVRSGLLYALPDDLDSSRPALIVERSSADLLRDGFDEWRPDALAGVLIAAAVVDGRIVSVCASVRSSASVHCAGVETLSPFRGRGFGVAAVAAWGRAVRAQGATPFYATTFDNTRSQRLAFHLGLRPVASEFSVCCDRTAMSDGRFADASTAASRMRH